jgi:hypothetical protein
MNRSPNFSTFQGRFALTLMPGNQQQNPVSGSNRALQPCVNRLPCTIKAVAMKI